MLRKVLSLAIVAVLFAACGNTVNENGDKKTEAQKEIVQVTFANLIENPAEYLDKEISFEGKIIHVCSHSGKKMFIIGEDPDIKLVITAGEEVPKFSMELEGTEISVTGLLAKVEAVVEKEDEGEIVEADDAEITEADDAEADDDQNLGEDADADADANAEESEESEEPCVTEAAVAAQSALAEFVLHYTKHTVK